MNESKEQEARAEVRRLRRLLREAYTRLDCDEGDAKLCQRILKALKRK